MLPHTQQNTHEELLIHSLFYRINFLCTFLLMWNSNAIN